ncbi:MAG: hypothetical protein EZS28_006618 [Streblomastix strix]|uniref:Uncharacterized protein n=1 Tax=Streblomastix strix TaxID=222440 RepID=A0A5J4WRY4_9EUKA|nr:MAG: hypothetical protein EZS28_006618 [Streblomastix strix]
MHQIFGDTDSMTWAISGNLDAEEGYRQKFKYLLGVSYEAEGTACIALAPKIHNIYNPIPIEYENDFNYLLMKSVILVRINDVGSELLLTEPYGLGGLRQKLPSKTAARLPFRLIVS